MKKSSLKSRTFVLALRQNGLSTMTAARAVCAEVLSVVHGIAVGNPRAGNRTPRAEALAIGYGMPYGLLAIGR